MCVCVCVHVCMCVFSYSLSGGAVSNNLRVVNFKKVLLPNVANNKNQDLEDGLVVMVCFASTVQQHTHLNFSFKHSAVAENL